MLGLSIHKNLKDALPELVLGCVSARVTVVNHCHQLWQEIDSHLAHLTSTMTSDAIASVPQIVAMRGAYKALGKDPSCYRGSAEALLRRVLSGKGLYQVNNVVDVNNLVSLESFQPLGSYDLDRLSGSIELRIGSSGETYKGISKEVINIESLPVFADEHGPFGSPTSDSERTMIREETRSALMVLFSFMGGAGVEPRMARAEELLRRYAAAQTVEWGIVG
jgi:DNA/RNA-binding domain of Phe-tRNA-synthetase-like protein